MPCPYAAHAVGQCPPSYVEDPTIDLVQAECVGSLIDEGTEQLRVAAQQGLERPALHPSGGTAAVAAFRGGTARAIVRGIPLRAGG
jgi:hypothetical protein